MAELPILIDCDPGLDDAVAIALAASTSRLRIDAITTVAGNAGLAMTTRNGLGIAAALGLGCGVHAGAAQPLVLPLRTSTDLWGGTGDLGLEPSTAAASPSAAARLIAFLDNGSRHSRVVVAIGPLTNLALALAARRDLADRIARLVVMGGGIAKGNATAHAELNIWVDPHAAGYVFGLGVPVVLAPLDVTEPLVVPAGAIASLAKSTAIPAQLVARLMPLAGEAGHPQSIYDAATIAYLLWPDLFGCDDGTIAVDVTEGPRMGETRFERSAGGPHRVLTSIDQPRFFDRLVATLAGSS